MANVYNVDYDTAIRVVRSEPNKILVDNDAMMDSRLSLSAKGLWIRIINLPDDADLSLEALKKNKSPRDSFKDIQDAYNELLQTGYIVETDE